MSEFSTAVVIPRWFRKPNKSDRVQFYGLAGRLPSRNLTDSTIAHDDGFEIGKKYEVVIHELSSNSYGRRFRWVCAGEWTGSLKKAREEYGDPVVINVESPDDFVLIGTDKAIGILQPIKFQQ